MGKYPESYNLAKKANGMFLQLKEDQISRLDSNNHPEGAQSEADLSVKVNLVISYFNMAIAAECTGSKKIALEHASQGYHFALVDLGPEHPLADNLQKYVDKLATEVAQGILLRPQPKPKKEDPSSRQHETSYFSRQSDTGVNDTSRAATTKRQARSTRDASSYNTGGSRSLRDRSIAIDQEGKHYLKFQRSKDEIAIAADDLKIKKPKRSKTNKPKILLDLKSFPKETMVEKKMRITGQMKQKQNDLALLLANIAGDGKRKSTSVKIKIITGNQRHNKTEYSIRPENLTFQRASPRSTDKGFNRQTSKTLEPLDHHHLVSETSHQSGLARKPFKHSKLQSQTESLEDREKRLDQREADLAAREELLQKFSEMHEVKLYKGIDASRNKPHEGSFTSQQKTSSKSKVRPKQDPHANFAAKNTPEHLEEWLREKNSEPVPKIGPLVKETDPTSKSTSSKGETERKLQEAKEHSALNYLSSKYDLPTPKSNEGQQDRPKKFDPQLFKFDPTKYDKAEEDALADYKTRLTASHFPGQIVAPTDNPKPIEEKQEGSHQINLEADDIYFNQFNAINDKDKSADVPPGEKKPPGQFNLDNDLKKTNSWANRNNYGMKKVVAYNIKYSTEEN